MNHRSVNINLPEDILSEIDGLHIQSQTLEDKLKLNLAIGMFVSKNVSLGKASQIAGKSLSEFIEILNHLNISAIEYTEEMYEDDIKFRNKYNEKSKA